MENLGNINFPLFNDSNKNILNFYFWNEGKVATASLFSGHDFVVIVSIFWLYVHAIYGKMANDVKSVSGVDSINHFG